MAYCAIADVRALNPKRTYDASSKPTSTQVEGYIDDIAAEMDSVLIGRSLTTPVNTPADFVTTLGLINAIGAAGLAELAMFPEQVGLASTPGSLYKQYKEKLEWLKSGQLPIETGSQPMSYFEEHAGEEDEPDTDEPEWSKPPFRMGQTF